MANELGGPDSIASFALAALLNPSGPEAKAIHDWWHPPTATYPPFVHPGCSHSAWHNGQCADCGKTEDQIVSEQR